MGKKDYIWLFLFVALMLTIIFFISSGITGPTKKDMRTTRSFRGFIHDFVCGGVIDPNSYPGDPDMWDADDFKKAVFVEHVPFRYRGTSFNYRYNSKVSRLAGMDQPVDNAALTGLVACRTVMVNVGEYEDGTAMIRPDRELIFIKLPEQVVVFVATVEGFPPPETQQRRRDGIGTAPGPEHTAAWIEAIIARDQPMPRR